jgi:phosphoglycerate-specific signal transduction histidine kinase
MIVGFIAEEQLNSIKSQLQMFIEVKSTGTIHHHMNQLNNIN